MKERILIVEDNFQDFEFLKSALEKENYQIFHAPNGKNALEILNKILPDLIILDIVLPDIDGFEICRRIRLNSNWLGLPILFYTSRNNIDDKVLGFEMGASDFLVKGSDPREILARVRHLLQYKKIFYELVKLSVVDTLTQVYNRRYFHHRLLDEFERSRRYKREFAFVLMDVDDFKKINDIHGHPTGDSVLKTIAVILRRHIRAADVLCRYGGDEFVLLLPETRPESAYVLTARVKTIVEKTGIVTPKECIFTSLSAGITGILAEEILGTDELITRADVALYAAKKAGRGQIKIYGKQEK